MAALNGGSELAIEGEHAVEISTLLVRVLSAVVVYSATPAHGGSLQETMSGRMEDEFLGGMIDTLSGAGAP
ncbi:hypothetical protein [Nonomuraea basaltis]|uniref:hypothetical protein n=1 Tax=Nonomuraea basaltis TaxID=2495887 RepID=UPI00110C7187|nr:hypothetical protein [Nonomuraea basaltis]TMR90999.1 hypothetical protein EJK15_52405 [Nonomuraea basaltis]